MNQFEKASTNKEIIDSFDIIRNLFENNLLKFTNINKEKLIEVAKQKRTNKNINWDIIKKKFGSLLKLIGYKEKELILWEKYRKKINNGGFLYDINNDSFISNRIFVKKFSVNSDSIMLISDKNKVFVKGHNVFNKFGPESYKNIEQFTELKNIPENCQDVVNGYSFSFYIYLDKVLACGCGEDGRTGTNILKINNFDKVLINDKVTQICCSSVSSAFLTESGDIYTCGYSIYNGHNEEENILLPKKINFDSEYKFIKISSGEGGYHFGALNENGDVYVWGHNRVGQLGINPKEMKEIKRELRLDEDNDDHAIVLTKPYKLNLKKRVFDIDFSWGHSCLFFSNNDISLFGRNCCNQLGLNKEICMIGKKSHEYFYKQNILNTHMKIDYVRLLKYCSLILSNNIIYYFGTLNELKHSNNNDFELKQLKNLSAFDVISIVDNNYVLIK